MALVQYSLTYHMTLEVAELLCLKSSSRNARTIVHTTHREFRANSRYNKWAGRQWGQAAGAGYNRVVALEANCCLRWRIVTVQVSNA